MFKSTLLRAMHPCHTVLKIEVASYWSALVKKKGKFGALTE